MSDSRSIAAIGRAPGSTSPSVGVLPVGRDSSFLIVSAWLSTSLRSRSTSAFISTSRILPLGRIWLAEFLPGSGRKIGEGKVNATNYSEPKEGS